MTTLEGLQRIQADYGLTLPLAEIVLYLTERCHLSEAVAVAQMREAQAQSVNASEQEAALLLDGSRA